MRKQLKMLHKCEARSLASAWSHGAVRSRCWGLEQHKEEMKPNTAELENLRLSSSPAQFKRRKPSSILFTLNIPVRVSSGSLKKNWVVDDESDNGCRKSGRLQVKGSDAGGRSPFWSCSCGIWRTNWPPGSRSSSPSDGDCRTRPEPPPFPWRAPQRWALSPQSWASGSKTPKVWVRCPQRYSQVQLFMTIYCSYSIILSFLGCCYQLDHFTLFLMGSFCFSLIRLYAWSCLVFTLHYCKVVLS